MSINLISFSRRHVLGALYGRCDPIDERIPVYLAGSEENLLGYVDQSLGKYADAFTFHLPDDYCKRMSAGQYTYSFDYKNTRLKKTDPNGRITLNSIIINMRSTASPPPTKVSQPKVV